MLSGLDKAVIDGQSKSKFVEGPIKVRFNPSEDLISNSQESSDEDMEISEVIVDSFSFGTAFPSSNKSHSRK